jgi:hypothetical protein
MPVSLGGACTIESAIKLRETAVEFIIFTKQDGVAIPVYTCIRDLHVSILNSG